MMPAAAARTGLPTAAETSARLDSKVRLGATCSSTRKATKKELKRKKAAASSRSCETSGVKINLASAISSRGENSKTPGRDCYFESYADYDVHSLMLQDQPRMAA